MCWQVMRESFLSKCAMRNPKCLSGQLYYVVSISELCHGSLLLTFQDCYSKCLYKTILWGPTCDVVDRICDTELPELSPGDWLYFDDVGAYSVSATTTFNGFQKLSSYYYITQEMM